MPTAATAASSLDPTLVAAAIAAAIVTVVGAIGGMTIQIVNAISSSRDRREAALERRILLEKTNATAKITDETAAKADTIIQKATEIHTLTNGTNSELTSALKVANQKIEGLQQLMASLMKAQGDAEAARIAASHDIMTALATPPPRPTGRVRASDAAPLQVEVVNQPLLTVTKPESEPESESKE